MSFELFYIRILLRRKTIHSLIALWQDLTILIPSSFFFNLFYHLRMRYAFTLTVFFDSELRGFHQQILRYDI